MTHPRSNPLRKLALLLVLAATPGPAQTTTFSAPTLKVNSRLTRVDITATDSNGHPILGLTQSDFTIKEDGKPQLIKNFEESGTEKPASTKPQLPLPQNTYTNAQPQPIPREAVNVLLVDDVSSGAYPRRTPENAAISRDQAIKYVHTMPGGTQVMVLEMSDQLRLVQNLTTDRDVLLAALHSITPKVTARTSVSINPFRGEACEAANIQAHVIVTALENASTLLSVIRGRKNVLWFTPGIPWLTNFTGFTRPRRIDCLRDYTPALERDYNLLAAAQIAIYPIDPRGIVVGRPPDPDAHFSMEDIADATGGRAFYNTNDLATSISDAISIGTHFYSLSYVPPQAKYDGQYHKINVTVDRPGIQLIYRKGYTSLDPTKRPPPAQKTPDKLPPPSEAALYAAMAHGAAPSTQLLFTVAVTPAIPPTHPGDPILGQLDSKLKAKALTRYDFNYTLAPDQITFTDDPEHKRHTSIEFTVAAYDGTGATLNVIRQTASLTLTPTQLAAFLKRNVPMHLQLDLPPGQLFLRAAVRDIPSNKLGTLEIPLTVPK